MAARLRRAAARRIRRRPTEPASNKAGLRSGDAFDISRAVQHRGAAFTDWPATTEITRLEFRATGVHVEFSKRDGPGRWPDVTPAGLGRSAPVLPRDRDADRRHMARDGADSVLVRSRRLGRQRRRSRPRDNGLRGTIHGDWCYSGEWGPMQRQPAAGERVGFFVVAGNVRGVDDVISVRERSNVVVVPFPDVHGCGVLARATRRAPAHKRPLTLRPAASRAAGPPHQVQSGRIHEDQRTSSSERKRARDGWRGRRARRSKRAAARP